MRLLMIFFQLSFMVPQCCVAKIQLSPVVSPDQSHVISYLQKILLPLNCLFISMRRRDACLPPVKPPQRHSFLGSTTFCWQLKFICRGLKRKQHTYECLAASEHEGKGNLQGHLTRTTRQGVARHAL